MEKYVGGKRKRYLQTLIPNLLFAYTTTEKAKEYVSNKADLSCLSFYFNHFEMDNESKNPPLTVSDEEMNRFILATCNMNKHLLFVQPSQCHFKGGEYVRVIDGPFTGVEGRVARVAGQQRVVISISNIGLICFRYIYGSSGYMLRSIYHVARVYIILCNLCHFVTDVSGVYEKVLSSSC